MNINSIFNVTAICNHFKSGEEKAIENDVNITLSIDPNLAIKFIFRFSPSVIELSENFKAVFKYDDTNNLIGLAFIKEDDIYVVKNLNKVFSEITEGYIRLRLLNKISNIMEFDFETAKEEIKEENVSNDEIPDEKFE